MRKLMLIPALVALTVVGAAKAATAPQNTSPPTTSGTMQEGSTLTADPGKWSGTQPITFAYQWRRCDKTGASCANIIGANSKTYKLTSVDIGNTLRVRVRATNEAGSSTALSAATGIVSAVPSPNISLNANRSLVVYGGSVNLSGTVSSGKAGESVTIMEHRLTFGRTEQVRQVATVTTQAGGSYSTTVTPVIRTIYVAQTGTAKSDPVAITVRPKLQMLRLGLHRFSVRVSAARSMVGKYVLIQRLNRRTDVWQSLRRVFLTRQTFGLSPTIVSSSSFRVRGGLRIRAFMPLSQAVPGYVSGTSKALTA